MIAPVLIANAIWLVICTAWAVLCFAQAKSDRAAGRGFQKPVGPDDID
jgi:hypothetical protein